MDAIPVISVAFCTDRTMEAALHVAALSVLNHLSSSQTARFHLLLTGFSRDRIDLLRLTLDGAQRPYEMEVLQAPDRSLFEGFRPLQGSLTPYHRLVLPDLVNEERLLYLDSDTLARIDVSPLIAVDMQAHATGFVVDGLAGPAWKANSFSGADFVPMVPLSIQESCSST